jgi:protein involved in polysaccharide export with SLBB domain
MARISALFLRLSVIACAVAMLLICVRWAHAQGTGGDFQPVPSATTLSNPLANSATGQMVPNKQGSMMQQPSTSAGIRSGAPTQPTTLYDAQDGPTAPMYGAPGPSFTPTQSNLYSAQSDPSAQPQGYYSTQIVPIQAAPQYGPPPTPQFAPPPMSQYEAPAAQPISQSYVSPAQPSAAPYSPGSQYGMPQRLLASASNAPLAGEGGYTLGLGDKVRVTVYDEPDLTGEYQVDGNGAIRLPLIGTLRASGYTAAGLEAEIRNALSPGYIKNPRINVEITIYRPIYVVGAVTKPGQYTYVNDMTLLNAVALAGGFTDQAVESTVYVRHEGEADEQPISTSLSLLIRPGDTVRVKTTLFWDAMNMFSPLAGPLAVGAAATH